MDTTVMEYTAEDLIAHKLQRRRILVAKPKFDREGADLLALLGVSDGAKFCRIQCKGRSLVGSSGSSVEVPKKYVTDGFILFLFVETGQADLTHLYCFFGRDIRSHWHQRGDSYVLSISRSTLESALAQFAFDDSKVHEIEEAITAVVVQDEFNKVISGDVDVTEESDTLIASGTAGAPPIKRSSRT
jgi:hypothetical protein